LARYRAYNAKRGRSARKIATSPAATTSQPTVSVTAQFSDNSASSSESVARYATPGSVSTPPRPESPLIETTSAATANASVTASGAVCHVKVKGKSRQNKAKGKAPAPVKETDVVPVRKPTRPTLPLPRTARPAVATPMPIPRISSLSTKTDSFKKRRVKLSPTSLARKVARASKRSSESLADDLANEYSLPSTERRANQNVIIGMRAARRHLCSRIRRALPFNRTKQDIREFLDTLEKLCQTAEIGPSDEEFV